MAMLTCLLLLIQPRPSADYRTLSAPAARVDGNILVLFRPQISEVELRAILARASARLADGPTATGAYVLDVEPGRREAAIAALRAQPGVMLAQPLDADPRR